MRKINLLDILGLTDNMIINRSIEIDSAEKLRELKLLERRKKYSKVFRYASMLAGSFAVLIIGIVLFNNNTNDNNVLIPNPMIQVKDIKELGNYIGLDLLKYEIKDIEEMYKFEDDNLIQIKYTDESTLRISKGVNDNSGIYGASLDSIEQINGIDVSIYKFDNTIYAVWNYNNYSFSYIFNDDENIKDILSELV